MTAMDQPPVKPKRRRRQKYSIQPLAPAVEDMESYGPCMLALNALQRRFVLELQLGPIGYGSEIRAVKAAGLTGSDAGLRVRASEFMHNEKIQRALREVGARMIRAAAFQSIRNTERIANDPLHKDCLRANLALMDRGFPTEVNINHNVNRSPETILIATDAVLAKIAAYAAQVGLDPIRQVEAAKQIECVAQEVTGNDQT